MKKTVLTFVAVAFGMSVAVAQTTPQTDQQQNTEQSISVDKMSDKPEEAGRRTIKVEELPQAVQANLKSDEFKAYKVVSVTEVKPEAGAATAAVQYEVALADGADAAAAAPSVLVLFDEKGKVVSQKNPSTLKGEEEEK
ncbi:hypothetical protein [Cesiribacter sp. SM1]|uniref:hypothetical protein n=1 Tax=Cesiribacter sp. SM1 TaxID=2861196 RepID=UPI001CD3560B|nr:hypothetical protein [Cesiribacter sp. SM1]